MRLNPNEIKVIQQNLLGADPHGKIFLYGSRVDDDRRGGDIDIFLETSKPLDLKSRLMLEYRLSSECDTKVDLLVKTRKTRKVAFTPWRARSSAMNRGGDVLTILNSNLVAVSQHS